VRLDLQGISAGYGGTTVLRDLSLTVPGGSVVALIGPNGAGKTTLLRVASGLLAPSRGRVEVDGRDLTGSPPDELLRAGVCHVPEGRGIFRTLTVRENLELFAPPGARAALESVVDDFPRLGQRFNQLAGTMSGGEQQMLALARAYLQRSPIVLLDEVSMGLAPKLVDEIFAFLRRLAASGSALLIVEQFVTTVLAMADYVYLLNRGRLAFVGDPDELAERDIVGAYLGAGVS
jgi:branched-chain amino acid transport system ATP-binding protein